MKLTDLKHLLDNIFIDNSPDIVLLNETWLSNHTPGFDIPGYNMYRNNRINKKAGGVGILCSNRLKTWPMNELMMMTEELECCAIKLQNS